MIEYDEFKFIRDLVAKLNEIDFILADEGVSYLKIDYPNRYFLFLNKEEKLVPLRIKLL